MLVKNIKFKVTKIAYIHSSNNNIITKKKKKKKKRINNGCFHGVRAHFKFVKIKFPNETRLHVH